jgi:hypothetical protein
MPCLVGILAFFFPRLVIILLALFTGYMDVYRTLLWPLLGFFFVPYATLAYAWAMNAHGSLQGGYLLVFIIAVLVDIGVIGGGERARRVRVVKVRRAR